MLELVSRGTGLFVAFATLAHIGVAKACPPVTLDPSKAIPMDGAVGVPIDSAVLVQFDSSASCASVLPTWVVEWKVTVTDDKGGLVPGLVFPWHRRDDCDPTQPGNLRWQHDAPFTAGTKHTVTVESTDVGGTHSYTTSFTTGDKELPPLVLEGALQASLKVVTKEYQLCMQPAPCGLGGGCTTSSRTDVLVEVSGVRAHGGQEELGYDFAPTLSIDEPQTWGSIPELAYSRASHAGAHQDLKTDFLALREYGKPYVPCISLLVWDAAGHFAQPTPLCLPSVFPESLLAGDAGGGSDAGAADAAQGAVPEPKDAAGCACSLPSHGSSPWKSAALVMIGLLHGARRIGSRRNRHMAADGLPRRTHVSR